MEHSIASLNRLAKKHNTTFNELEAAMEYKPSFAQLASVVGLAKRTFFNAGGLQSVAVNNIMLLRLNPLDTDNNATWLDLNHLQQHHQLVAKTLIDCLTSQDEIPTLLIIAQLKDYKLQLDPLAWQEMLEANITNNLPPVLEQVLRDLAEAKQQLKNLHNSIADNLFLTQNCWPSFPLTESEPIDRSTRTVDEITANDRPARPTT
jgi:hypothetical protein